MKKRTTALFLVGALLIFLLFKTLDMGVVMEKLSTVPSENLLYYSILLSIIQVSIMLLSALKWRVVLRNSDVSMKNIIPATFVGYLINNITPVGLAGGEPVRAYILYKTEDVDMPTAASSVIVDLFLEIFPVFIIILVSLGIVLHTGAPLEFTIALSLMLLVLTVFFIVVVSVAYNKRYSTVFLRVISKVVSVLPFFKRYSLRLRDEFDEIVDRFDRAMKLHLLDKEIIIQGVSFSMTVWILRIIRLYISFMALGVLVSFPTVIVVETMVSAVSFLPLLPGALGIWEWASVELFSVVSLYSGPFVTREFAALATLVNRFFFYLIPSLLGVLSVLYLGMSLSRVTDSDEEKLRRV